MRFHDALGDEEPEARARYFRGLGIPPEPIEDLGAMGSSGYRGPCPRR